MQGAECLPKGEQCCGDAVSPAGATATHATSEGVMDIEEIIGFEALYNSMNKCVKGVLWKDGVACFYHNWIREILRLERELHDGTYRERKAKFFEVTEPKQRMIMSIAFRDRVFQRSLNDVAIYPATTRSFIYDNHACQKGKGTDKAKERLLGFIRAFYRKYGTDGYVLQCDIKGYYPNMQHDVAKKVLRKYLDDDVFCLVEPVLDNFPGEVGFNPGSQIIQIVGITAPNRLDHIIKERLRIKYYIRYMDDFILISHDKSELEHALVCIKNTLAELGMELNAKKTGIYPITKGIKFLGFYFTLKETGKVVVSIDPKKVKHERRKLRRMAALVKRGKKSKETVDEHFASWKVHASYGDSYKMLQRMDEFYKELWRENDGI